MNCVKQGLFCCSSKLLQQLDKASEDDPVGIEEAVLDKGQYTIKMFRNVSFMAGFPFRRLQCNQLIREFPESFTTGANEQSNKPIITQIKYMQALLSAGK